MLGGSRRENSVGSRRDNVQYDVRNTRSARTDAAHNRGFQAVPYTEEERKRIQGLLDKVLGPEYVSSRPSAGGQRVSYIEGWKALNLANEVFGFNGWSSELISTQVDFLDVHGTTGRISMGLSVVVRITIKDGTFHEDFGYGFIENAKNKAMAFEKCKKEAFTDGLKRCLRCFGNVLGNCLYDRTIISKIQKVRLPAPDLEASHFHRDPLIADRENKKKNTVSVNISEKKENSGETTTSIGNEKMKTNQSSKPPAVDRKINHRSTNEDRRKAAAGADVSQAYEIVGDFDDSFVFSDDPPMDDDLARNDGLDDYDLQMLLNKEGEQDFDSAFSDESKVSSKDAEEPKNKTDVPGKSDEVQNSNKELAGIQPAVFISAKRAELIQKTPEEVTNIPQYDASFLTPNIRRTVDPSKSIPIKRSEVNKSNNDINKANNTPMRSQPRSQTSVSYPLTTTNTGKRMVGMPPSQRPPLKKMHKEYVSS